MKGCFLSLATLLACCCSCAFPALPTWISGVVIVICSVLFEDPWRSCECKILRGQWGWTCRIVHWSTLLSMVAQGCVLALHLYVPTDTPVSDVYLSHTVSKKILDPTDRGWVQYDHMMCPTCQCFFPWHWGCVKRSMKGDKLANRFEARVISGCWFSFLFPCASKHQHFSRLSLLLPCRC